MKLDANEHPADVEIGASQLTQRFEIWASSTQGDSNSG